ncbi:ubiquinone biosynthesis protein [Clostridium algifaecis]|uniref:Ubiquinone biosynthesis protein n=1 Tax=Clostridium algifaecis TaxID=1472040 RepID=A0ABS4KVN6_9CLOT|nr:AarF/ABC1/UbiB kinase family protein [Clostridium algifaecis]MBP2034075.1 ubiquinone biosynthesis protein [Clostridium algifaecis]
MQKKSSKRFKEIVKVLGKYGFKFVINTKNNRLKKSPENLRKAFEELGPTFIKIGQILSSRPDILPPQFINELSKLQDDVPPEKYEDINKVFFRDFNKNIDECFSNFEKIPFASASIAQVYNAILKDGREVIVKIQRPNIREKMETDISILYKIIKFTKRKFEDSIIDPEEALDELKFSTSQEFDFNLEAENMIKFKKLNNNVAFCHVPYVIKELSKDKVLTMEKIDGFKINNLEKLKEGGYDLNDLGKKLTISFFKQVFTDGFFHADPHPGNLLIQENKICFLDFGIMGNIYPSLKLSLNEIIISIVYKDLDKLVSVIISIGIKRGLVDRNRLYEDIDILLSNYLSTSLQNIKISVLITEIFKCAKNNNIRLPKDLILLVKSLIIVEGLVSEISPEIQILDIAVPFVKNSSKSYFLKSLNLDDILISSYNFTKNSVKLPTKIVELIDGILSGRAKLQLKLNKIDSSIEQLNKMTNRLSISLISCSMLISSSLILNLNIGPRIYNMSLLGLTGLILSLIIGFILIISIIKSNKL